MSDQADVADEKPMQKPPDLTVTEALQFIKDNFVLVSAGALLTGVALATTFITAYLSMFDWHLICTVQNRPYISFVPSTASESSLRRRSFGALTSFLRTTREN